MEDTQPVIDAGIPPERRAVFLFNPNMTHRIRQQVFFTSGAEGFVAAGKILGMEVHSSLQNQPAKLVNVILPEVVLKSDRENQIEAFADAMAAEISENSDITVELFFGALLKEKNVILYGQWQNGQKSLGIVREKSLLFPFFEAATFGIDMRGPNAGKEQQIDFPVLISDTLPPYARVDAFDICYESLFLQRWHFGKPKLVVANHGAFYNSLFLSNSYDLMIQTLSTVFQAPLIIVSNRGVTGVFATEKDRIRVSRFFDNSPNKPSLAPQSQVDFLRVVGF